MWSVGIGSAAAVRDSVVGLCVVCCLYGCTAAYLDDCPDRVLNENEPRLRTSHYRIALANPAAAARRLLPYAIMSAYAYRDGPTCEPKPETPKISPDDEAELRSMLARATPQGSQWQPTNLHPPGECEDDIGLMYNVWERTAGDQAYVVIAFRGTDHANDWLYGNAWWFIRFLPMDNQLKRAAKHAEGIIDAYKDRETKLGHKTPIFVTTGHSLGGGLAQFVLYKNPLAVSQAIVFDPSPVTGFVAAGRENEIEGCSCHPEMVPKNEPRIIRAYVPREALSYARIFHKLVFAPERHIWEVRFPDDDLAGAIAKHGMKAFAYHLQSLIDKQPIAAANGAWYTGTENCTKWLEEQQSKSCSVKVNPNARLFLCPR